MERKQSFWPPFKLYVMGYSSKTKQVCQIELTKIWNDIKTACDFRKSVE